MWKQESAYWVYLLSRTVVGVASCSPKVKLALTAGRRLVIRGWRLLC